MIITCDRCKNEFVCMLKEQEKTLDDMLVIRTYFVCPACKAQYDICYDNLYTLGLKKRIRKQVDKLTNTQVESQYRKKLKRLERTRKELDKKCDILRNKYERYFREGE